MLIPADVIYEKLEAVYNFSAFRNGEEKMVRGVCFYTQKDEDENSIILCPQGQFPIGSPRTSNIYVLTGCTVPEGVYSCDFLSFSQKILVTELYNCIFSIFRDFLVWEEQLQSCENSFTGIKGMMRISYYFSNADFVLTDSNLHYLYYTKSFLDYHFMENKLSAVPTQDIVRILLNDPDFHLSFQRKEVFYFPNYEYKYPAICYNLHSSDSKLKARLMLIRNKPDYTAADRFVLKQLGDRIAKILQSQSLHSIPLDNYRNFRKIFHGLIDGSTYSNVQIESALSSIGWSDSAENTYHLVLFLTAEEMSETSALSYMTNYLEMTEPDSFAVVHERKVFWLVKTESLLEDKIRAIAECFNTLAAISLPFYSIAEVPQGVQMVRYAVKIGTILNMSDSFYNFKDYQLEYLLRYGRADIDAEYLMHPAVKTFYKHDQRNGTDYIHTLKEYILQNGSPTHTARALFIHRSTLLERLDKMNSICSLEAMNSWDGRLHIALSLSCLRQ